MPPVVTVAPVTDPVWLPSPPMTFPMQSRLDYTVPVAAEPREELYLLPEAIPRKIVALEKEMAQFAQKYEYEKAAELRDQIRRLRERIKSPT